MISTKSKEEILSAAHIEEVVGEFVNLKKRGSNYVGLCPFHTEKTPSFHVSPSKGIYKCFGCGKAGDSIGFVMEHEKFTYPEALRFLAQKYHINLEETGDIRQEQDDKMVKESLFIITQFAQQYYQDNLWKSAEGKTVGLAYFKERGISEDLIKKFSLGYALKDPEAFTKAAIKSGYQSELLRRAGLIVERASKEMDFFHHRVIFSIQNLSGRPVAFAGRMLGKSGRGTGADERSPKYINSPETEIYHKSQLVYGIFQARNAIRKEDECFLVEGYMDVIALHLAGVENVVASSGTSLTTEQVKLISRFTNNLTLLYDGDEAGIKATLRGLELMVAENINVRIVALPEGDDPDSYLHKNGSTALREYIRENKKHFLLFKIEKLLAETGSDPLKKADAINDVVKTLALVPDVVRRSVLIKESGRLFSVDEQILTTEVNKLKRKQFKKESAADSTEANLLYEQVTQREDHSQPASKNSDEFQERDVLRILLEFGEKKMQEEQTVAEFILSEVKEIPVNNMLHRLMLHEMEAQLESGNIPNHQYFLQHADEQLRSLTLEIISSPYQLSENWSKMHDIFVKMPVDNFKNDVTNALDRFKLKRVTRMIEENLKDLKEAKGNAEEEQHYQMVHGKLNEWKMLLGKKLGTVIVG